MTTESLSSFQKLLNGFPNEAKAKGDAFEKCIKWLIQNEHIYTSQFSRVWLWNEWPGRTGPDIGVDLVAETHKGDLWAIQAKAYAEDTTVSRDDVASFFEASSRLRGEDRGSEFAGRLFFASNNAISRHARDAFALSHIPSILVQRNLLELLDWPEYINENVDNHFEVTRKIIELRDYQVEAVDAIVSGFQSNDRGQLIMACGTGKTLVALRASEKVGAKKILVLLPSIALLNQTLISWSKNYSGKFRWLAVCSDSSVDSSNVNDDLIENVVDCGFPVTTDSNLIREFLLEEKYGVVFSTYQSSIKLAEAIKGCEFNFDFGIFDEAHKCAGATNGIWTYALNDENIPIKNRLFNTATPRIVNSKDPELEIFSMSDSSIFGEIFYSFSFGEAISQNYLTDYKIVIVGVDAEKYETVMGIQKVELNEKLYDFTFISAAVVLSKLINRYHLRNVISFHSRVKRAEIFARDFPSIFHKVGIAESFMDIPIVYSSSISGDMPSWERSKKLSNFNSEKENQFSLITNARCLTEGVDVPSLDGIVFVDPKWSEVDIVQAVGRVIRFSEDKQDGYVIIPIPIPTTNSSEDIIDSSNFALVWSVVNALKAHDNVLAEELAVVRRNIGYGKGLIDFPKKIVIDMGDSELSEELIRAIQEKLVKSSTRSWEEYFGALKLHFEKHGHSNIHREGKGPQSMPLGTWVVAQRTNRKKGILDSTQIELLNSLNFRWEKNSETWDINFDDYSDLLKRNQLGNLTPRLRAWHTKIVRDYKNGKLSREKVEKLASINFEYIDNSAERVRVAWQNGFDAYFTNYGSRPIGEGPNSEYIMRWARIQRQNYARGKLDQTLIDLLESKGFSWTPVEGEFGIN